MYDQIHRGEKTATAELRLKGDLGWCRVTLSTFSYQEDRSPALVVGIIEDITKAKEMEVALEKARSQDPLTGLYCKDAGVRLVREYLETKNPNQVCTMMLLDMDDFKAVNACLLYTSRCV